MTSFMSTDLSSNRIIEEFETPTVIALSRQREIYSDLPVLQNNYPTGQP